ncbi:MAG: carbohydrate ABC transporter permease [Anaerolineaceae bacterium]
MNKFNQKVSNVLIFILLLALSISNVYPMVFMLLNSFKSRTDYQISPFSFFRLDLTLDNFVTMISQFKILALFKNSFIISFFTILLLLAIGIVASYAFAKLNFKGMNVVYFLIIATMFIPVQVTIIPLYLLFSKLHLVNSHWSVILTYLGLFLPEAILLMTSTFRGIPDEMIEAARLDGAGYFGIMRYIIVPMGMPAIVLCIIFYFIVTWNDLFTPMILLQDMNVRTVMVALASLLSRYTGDPTLQFAGLVLAAIPAILVYVIFQRFIIRGIGAGAFK